MKNDEHIISYSSSQPVASVIINFEQIGSAGPFTVVDGRVSVPAITVMDLVRMAQDAASAEVAHGLLQQFFDALDDALSKERASPWTGLKGAKFQDRMLAWNRVQELRRRLLAAPVAQKPPQITDARIEEIVTELGARWDGSVWKIEDADLHPLVRAMLYRYTTAPVAQEPVSVTERWQDGDDSNMVSRVKTATPVAAQDRDDETLADTQRAIIEAAEQRGYARALVECGQDHENAKRYTWLRDHPPKDCQGGMRVRIWGESGDWISISGEKLDAAIDAAWAAKEDRQDE